MQKAHAPAFTALMMIWDRDDTKKEPKYELRLFCVLWERVLSNFIESDDIYNNVGLNFFFMELSMIETPEFNETMQEIFANTNKGVRIVDKICGSIVNKKEEEDFNNYIEQNNRLYPIQDGYFLEGEFSSEMPQSY